MPARRSVIAVGTTALALVPATAALAKVSHANMWTDKAGTVVCGIKIHAKSRPASQVICGAQGLHAPGNVGDPFVQIAAHGKPHTVRFSQKSFVGTHPVTLKPGSTWSALGVTCTVKARTAKCTNRSGHGFTIGKNLYKAF